MAPSDQACEAQREIEALQNQESGPLFSFEMLSNTLCHGACDHKQRSAWHELALYRESAAVTVHWTCEDIASKIDGRIVCRCDGKACGDRRLRCSGVWESMGAEV